MRFSAKTLVSPLLCVALLSGLMWFTFPYWAHRYEVDPDRYFHLAVSRIYATEGLPKGLPQAEDLGWQEYFPEKEFLFHVYTGALHRICGEGCVEKGVLFLGALSVLILFGVAAFHSSAWPALVVTMLIVFSSVSIYVTRLTMLRPQILAIILFVLLMHFCMTFSRWGVFAVSLLYALSYHGIYAPISVLLVFMVCGFFHKLAWKNIAGAGFGGLFLGLILNPYFPANLQVCWQAIKTSVGAYDIPEWLKGTEMLPIPAPIYFAAVFIPALVLFLWWAQRFYTRTPPTLTDNQEFKFQVSFLVFLGYAALAAFNPRAFEFAIPAAVIFSSLLIAHARDPLYFLAAVVLISIPVKRVEIASLFMPIVNAEASEQDDAKIHRFMERALRLIQESEGRVKIFNCMWNEGAFILYHRPQSRFVDLLDPSYLYEYDAATFQLKKQIISGMHVDPLAAILNVFAADYILCSNAPQMTAQLEGDPRLSKLTANEPPASDGRALYKINKETLKNFATFFKITPEGQSNWSEWDGAQASGANYPLVHVDLRRSFGLEAISKDSQSRTCFQAMPRFADEVFDDKRRSLAVGGADIFRVELNGKLLFVSPSVAAQHSLFQEWITLPRALHAEDKLLITVCSERGAPLGLSASLWPISH